MSRCRQTEALLHATFAGIEITRVQAGHVSACAECAHALAEARAFDNELHSVGFDLTPEPMLPAPVSLESARDERRDRPMRWRRGLVGGVAVVLLAAVVVGGGQWPWSLGGDQLPGTGIAIDQPTDERVMSWASGIEEAALRLQGRRNADAGWELIRVEHCGSVGMAFFVGLGLEGERTYVWGSGPIDVPRPTTTGLSASVDDRTAARLRATLPPCDVMLDRVAQEVFDEVGDARDLWTLTTGDEAFEGEARVIGVTPIREGHRAGPNGEKAIPTFLMLLERQTERAHWIERPSISVMGGWTVTSSVGDRAAELGLAEAAMERDGRPVSMRVFADPSHPDETLFGWIDDPRVRAVDISIPREGTVLRYSVAKPGFIIQFDARVGLVDEMQFELIDAAGTVLASGSVAAWLFDQPPS
ncbi:MAG: hypothetical protein M3406_07210 [Chloroflexota bacterium]|nr:hypothetical protein [Chloroflexota bacterium]